ncbi:MAG: class I SAM-dependent methyltransferase [Desulfobaccales bacterium]|nr:class I SAM-dependent methyltransferase [Desulfobaccales bacterium]
MVDWGEIFTDPEMQRLKPNPELLTLLPLMKKAGCRLVLDAGCGAGRHLLPLALAGFLAWGVDREVVVLQALNARLKSEGAPAHLAHLARADLRRLPFLPASFDLAVSINAINHGDTQTFKDYCRELDRVLMPGGHLFIYTSPREAGERVRLPQTLELEPDTLVDIATPDGNLVHHFPTPEELKAQFPQYQIHRWETVLAPIPFMGDAKLPQLIFWAQKHG